VVSSLLSALLTAVAVTADGIPARIAAPGPPRLLVGEVGDHDPAVGTPALGPIGVPAELTGPDQEPAESVHRRTDVRDTKRILVMAVACVALAACGEPSSSPQPAAPSASAVTDCGTFTLSQGERLAEQAARCLVEAVQAGRPARLKVTRPTTEGDPIPVTYTAGADGRIEVVTDSRQDEFGEQTITRATCTGPVATPGLDFADCAQNG
jgi:hypothetical protein